MQLLLTLTLSTNSFIGAMMRILKLRDPEWMAQVWIWTICNEATRLRKFFLTLGVKQRSRAARIMHVTLVKNGPSHNSPPDSQFSILSGPVLKRVCAKYFVKVAGIAKICI